MSNLLRWIQNWFYQQCDCDWEHENQIKIESVDNPGWIINIDLYGTVLEGIEYDGCCINNGVEDCKELENHDWFVFKITRNKFIGAGDVMKLEFILAKFKEFAETKDVSVLIKKDK